MKDLRGSIPRSFKGYEHFPVDFLFCESNVSCSTTFIVQNPLPKYDIIDDVIDDVSLVDWLVQKLGSGFIFWRMSDFYQESSKISFHSSSTPPLFISFSPISPPSPIHLTEKPFSSLLSRDFKKIERKAKGNMKKIDISSEKKQKEEVLYFLKKQKRSEKYREELSLKRKQNKMQRKLKMKKEKRLLKKIS